MEEFDRISRRVPQIASIYPASQYDMVDFHKAGGVPAILKGLAPLLHGDALTVTGEPFVENLKLFHNSANPAVIRDLASPFSREGGVVVDVYKRQL